jgi:phytol kinase
MISAAISLGLIFLLLIISEYLWRTNKLEAETSRKIIHIGVGTFIAFWPLYMSWSMIQLLAGLLFIGILLSFQLGVFGAIHKIKQQSSGELWFPVGIVLAALFTNQPWIFTIAVLHLALADGFASIIGYRYGLRHYQIGQHTKSLIGSFTFFLTSMVLSILAYIVLLPELPGTSLAVFALTPFLATAVESISRNGIDNVLIPLAVVFAFALPTGTLVLNI